MLSTATWQASWHQPPRFPCPEERRRRNRWISSFPNKHAFTSIPEKRHLLLLPCSSYLPPPTCLLFLASSSAPSPLCCLHLGSLSSSSRAPSDPYLPCAWLKQIHLNLLHLIPEERRAVERELDSCGSWRGLDPLPIQDPRQTLSQGATRLCQLGEADKFLGGPFTTKDSSEALEPSS